MQAQLAYVSKKQNSTKRVNFLPGKCDCPIGSRVKSVSSLCNCYIDNFQDQCSPCMGWMVQMSRVYACIKRQHPSDKRPLCLLNLNVITFHSFIQLGNTDCVILFTVPSLSKSRDPLLYLLDVGPDISGHKAGLPSLEFYPEYGKFEYHSIYLCFVRKVLYTKRFQQVSKTAAVA